MKLSDLPKHHAVLVISQERESFANNFWNELIKESPAHNYFKQTILDIDTVRKIIAFANSSQSGDRTALVSFHTATIPAQNAMLKILEEPKIGVSFILVTSNRDVILPTVISRVHEMKIEDKVHKTEENASLFLRTKPVDRMELSIIKELLERKDDNGRNDREAIRNFILSLAEYIREKMAIEKKLISKHLLSVNEVASYASDPSGSGKMLLEYLSLYLPQIK